MKQKEDVSKNITIMEGSISKFLNKHNNLVKRYLVLNQYGFFVYKDEQAFKSFPQRPAVVMPVEEIASINQREFSAQQMLKNQNSTAFRSNEVVHVMEVALK